VTEAAVGRVSRDLPLWARVPIVIRDRRPHCGRARTCRRQRVSPSSAKSGAFGSLSFECSLKDSMALALSTTAAGTVWPTGSRFIFRCLAGNTGWPTRACSRLHSQPAAGSASPG
jgi:hypothetical protein